MDNITNGIYEPPYSLTNRGYTMNNGYGINGTGNARLTNENEEDLNYQYNEFLKNDLDFAESPNYLQSKYEDHFFDLSQPKRARFESFEAETNQKSSNFFQPEQEFEYERKIQRNNVLTDNFAENFEIPNSNAYNRIPDAFPTMHNGNHTEFSQYEFRETQEKNIGQQFTDNLPSRQVENKDFQLPNALANQPQSQANRLEEIKQNVGLTAPITPIKTKTNEINAIYNYQESYSYLNASIKLSQPFIMQRNSSAGDSLTTQATSQSSSESRESKKKWAEVSSALHNGTPKSKEAESPAKKRNGKKKVKTASDEKDLEVKGNVSQPVKQESSYSQVKPEFSANQFQREVSANRLRYENSMPRMNSEGSNMLVNSQVLSRANIPTNMGEYATISQLTPSSSRNNPPFQGYSSNNGKEYQQSGNVPNQSNQQYPQHYQQQYPHQQTQQAQPVQQVDPRQQQQLQLQRQQQLQMQYQQQQQLQAQKLQNGYPQQYLQQNSYLQQRQLYNPQQGNQNIREQQYPQLRPQPQQTQMTQQQQYSQPQPQQQKQQMLPLQSQNHQPHPQSHGAPQAQSIYNPQQHQQYLQQNPQYPKQPQQQHELQQSRSSSNQYKIVNNPYNTQQHQANANQHPHYPQQNYHQSLPSGSQQQSRPYPQMMQQTPHSSYPQNMPSQSGRQQNYQPHEFNSAQQPSNHPQPQPQQRLYSNMTQQNAPMYEPLKSQRETSASQPAFSASNSLSKTAPSLPTKINAPLPNNTNISEFAKNNLPFQPESGKSSTPSNLLTKIQSNQNRLIGTLTPEERKAKVNKYLEKRKQRSLVEKQPKTTSRKKAATNRPRVKGKFVTKQQDPTAAANQNNESSSFPQYQVTNHIQEEKNQIGIESHEIASDSNRVLDSPFRGYTEGNKDFFSSELDAEYYSFF